VASYGAGFAIQGLAGPDAWRWMLASSAVPAVITLLLRLGTPVSPRWLMSRGRVEEARRIVHTYIGPGYELDEADAAAEPVRYGELFTRRYRARTIFAGTFWLCQVFPYFAIGTFLPAISHALGLGGGLLGEVLYNLLLLLGAVVGFLVMDLLPRRRFVIATFAVVCVALVVLGLAPSGPLALVLLAQQRRADGIVRAHGQAEHQAQHEQQHRPVHEQLGERGEHEHDQVEHQDLLPADAVGDRPEDQRAEKDADQRRGKREPVNANSTDVAS
jgi:MFS family permease